MYVCDQDPFFFVPEHFFFFFQLPKCFVGVVCVCGFYSFLFCLPFFFCTLVMSLFAESSFPPYTEVAWVVVNHVKTITERARGRPWH